jgi:hypothetical protein
MIIVGCDFHARFQSEFPEAKSMILIPLWPDATPTKFSCLQRRMDLPLTV